MNDPTSLPQIPTPRAALHTRAPYQPRPMGGMGGLGNGPPACKAFLRKMDFCERKTQSHNVICGAHRFLSTHRPQFSSNMLQGIPTPHRATFFVSRKPPTGFGKDLNHYARAARPIFAAPVPEATKTGNFRPDNVRNGHPLFFISFDATSSPGIGFPVVFTPIGDPLSKIHDSFLFTSRDVLGPTRITENNMPHPVQCT